MRLSPLLLTALLSCQPTTPTPLDAPGDHTFGEVTYGVVATGVVDGETCPDARYTVLVNGRESLIDAIDTTVTDEAFHALPGLVGDLAEPLVLDGTLPASTELIADLLAMLIDDETDPDRDVLTTLLDLKNVGIEPRLLLAVVHRLFDEEATTDVIPALVELAQHDDGLTTTWETTLGLLSRLIIDLDTVPTCTDAEWDFFTDQILGSDGIGPDDGRRPAHSVLVDERGVPRVRDDASGSPISPFVDADGDGLVDVDADFYPVDAAGDRIDLSPFTGVGTRDTWGRPITEDEEFYFRYRDVEGTSVGHIADILRDALEQGIHENLGGALSDMLGEPVECAASPDCRYYPPEATPFADLAYLAIGAMEDPAVRAAALRGTSVACGNGDDLTDLVDVALLAAGRLMAQTEPEVDVEVDMGALLEFVDTLQPNLEALFAPGTGGRSHASRLLDALDRLDPQTIDQFGYGLAYAEISSPGECDGAEPSGGGSRRVDYTVGRDVPSTGINRSAAERLVALIRDVDACYPSSFVTGGASLITGVPWGEYESMAVFIMRWLGSTEASTVCNLASSVDSLEFLLGPAIGAAGGCPAYVDVNEFQALDDMANSGALDIYGVISSELMHDPTGIPSIIALFGALADNAEEGDASVFRQLEPWIVGGIETPTSATDPMGLVQAGLMAGRDLSICDRDTLETVVDIVSAMTTRRTITRRDGSTRTNTTWLREIFPLVQELLPYAERISDEDWDALTGFATDLLATPRSTPAGDRLADPRLASTVRMALDLIAGRDDLPADRCLIGGMQELTNRFLTGENLPAFVRLVDKLQSSDAGTEVEDLMIRFLTPGDETARAATLALLGRLIQPKPGEVDLGPLLDFASTAINPYRADQTPLLDALDALLAADEDDVLRKLIARATDQGPTDAEVSPIETVTTIGSDVLALDDEGQCQPSPIELALEDTESFIESTVDFLRDDTGGMGFLYTWIRRRAAALEEG